MTLIKSDFLLKLSPNMASGITTLSEILTVKLEHIVDPMEGIQSAAEPTKYLI